MPTCADPMTSQNNPALEPLLFTFRTGLLTWPGTSALFLRARAGAALTPSASPWAAWEHSSMPGCGAVQWTGVTVDTGGERRHQVVLVLPPRQRDEARALLAEAAARAQGDDALLVASVRNSEGVKAIEADVSRTAGQVETLSKHK